MSGATNRSTHRVIRGMTLAALCALAAACASSNLAVLETPQANSQLVPGYLIDAGDRLKVTVFDEEALTGEYEVGIDGAISLPLLQPIPVKGLTPTSVAKLIEENLAQGGYVLYPKVSIDMLQYRPFYILGEVNKPGEYEHGGELTLAQAIAKAGGYTARAQKNSVVLKRQDWPENKLIRLGETALLISPGDTITVQESIF